MPDMPHPIYGTPYPSFPRRREARPFPCGTVGEKRLPHPDILDSRLRGNDECLN